MQNLKVNTSVQICRFPVLVWEDSAGFFTAALADAEGTVEGRVPVVGYGPTQREAIGQVKEYVTWFYAQYPWAEAPTVKESKLAHFKVKVRPEYRVGERVHPYDRNLTLTLAVVDSLHHGGMRSAVIPRLDVEFFYTQGQLKDLVQHYVRERLAGLAPHLVARFLVSCPESLEYITAKTRGESRQARSEPRLEALSSVADALGTKGFKTLYSRPYGRDASVEELVRRLAGRGSNVLLVGERGSGKTAVLLEAVRKLERNTPSEAPTKRRFWMTRGARLIAGMRYLGQWEERTEEVIGDLAGIDGILCAENLLELVQTGGQSPESSVGAFMVPYLERAELYLVAEVTPDELDTCRRLLPALVELFTVLPLPEMSGDQALAVLGQVAEQLGQKYRLEAPSDEVVAEVCRLHRRFLPYHAFPGKAGGFLSQIYDEASRQKGGVPTPSGVVERFSRETGLPLRLVRDEDLWPAEEMAAFFEGRIVGQPAACQAATALVSTFKAGLNDPDRPLGVLLFCGPTGVGKTEMAKAISSCFFGAGKDQDRLVRLDMSEYSGYGAASRLLGTRERPGELVRRVRRQPFTVVLLDEIEKADPDIFDLLLGVFDEGRLTDAWGRTTTFRSAVIIMTSNLGVSGLHPIGLSQKKTPSYLAEIMDFFRPEFFNRIDSVISFSPLEPEHIRAIAALELQALSRREGLQRRGLRLRWTEGVVARLAELGFDALYGARPLKRVLEERVVVPLARYLVDHPELRDAPVDLELDGDRVVLI